MEELQKNLNFGHIKMKKINVHIILLIVLINTFNLFSQNKEEFRSIDINHIEKVNTYTDRSLYIIGEKIMFSSCVYSENNNPLSKVLYVELVDKNKNQIVGKKFLLTNFVCNGFIDIPSYIPTGVYYIKSYTKYMRNYDSDFYCYSRIKIINSNEKYIPDQNNDISQSINQFFTDSLNNKDFLDLELNKKEYSLREIVKVKIKSTMNDSILNCCISVVPKNSAQNQTYTTNKSFKEIDTLKYYHETKGITLSGIIKKSNTENYLSSTRVNLSIIGENNDFIATYTNENGQFFFPLPDIKGQRDVFICSEKFENSFTEILIDNDFSPEMVSFTNQEFFLTREEQEIAQKLNLNVELKKFFNNEIKSKPDTTKHNNIPFYGTPSKILFIDQYVQLPTIEDYFNELSYYVKVRKSHKNKYLKILGNQSEIGIYDPLVLIDMVAINSIDEILSIPSHYISQIDIINTPYVKGNLIFGGIVSLRSKNNDFGKISLPHSGTFINYRFISDSDYEVNTFNASNIPDTRNTLFWEPHFVLNKNENKSISFITGDTPEEYQIIVRGILTNGETFEETISFQVK